MPTTVTDQFFLMDPANPPAPGTALTVANLDLTDQNDDNDFDRFNNDSIDGSDITASWPGDVVTYTLPDGSTQTVTGTTFYLADGRRVFTPTDGSVLQDGIFTSSTFVNTQGPLEIRDLGPPCFVKGTMIATAAGPRAVEDIRPGDLVLTADNGPMPVVRPHTRSYGVRQLQANPKYLPVVVRKGALGYGLPERDLYLSGQHRVLLRSPIVQRMYGTPEVLAPVAQMVGHPGIERVETDDVTYVHLAFARHHVIISEGAETESLYLGPFARDTFSDAEYADLMAKMKAHGSLPDEPARELVKGPKLKNAIARHMKNNMPLCAPAEDNCDSAA